MSLRLKADFCCRQTDKIVKDNAEKFLQCFSAFDMTGWRAMPEKTILEDILATADSVKDCESFVVCGIGGSALGTRAVHTALNGCYYNENKARKTPKLYIEDNIDPARVAELFECIDITKTVFNFVSKSGNTLETSSQQRHICKKLLERGLDLSRHVIFTLGNTECETYEFAKRNNIKTFLIPKSVGGRFSVFTPVGLLPLAVAGIDISELLCGAESAQKTPEAALRFAAATHIEEEAGKNIIVLMPYVGTFKYISEWFVQLWAESLGKEGKGQAPLAALGTTDQHSLLQMLMEGADDKTVVFIETEKYAGGLPSFGQIQTASLQGVRQALTVIGRNNMTILLPAVTARSVGELLMFFMLSTAYAGAIRSINPYDQPGVEMGKKITRQIIDKLPNS